MLRRLTVENYALIEQLELELDPTLNIITGQTGAGKSILLGALTMLLGGKCDSASIKESGRRCLIEAEFDLSRLNLRDMFEQHDWEYDNEVILRRVVSPSGKSRAFVNDMPVQIAELKALGGRLIDIHSQHQNLILSDESFRIKALDTIAGAAELARSYRTAYELMVAARSELSALKRSEAEARRNREWLEYQLEELTAVALVDREDEAIEQEITMLENADQIGSALGGFAQRMEQDEVGVLTQLKSCESEISYIVKSYPVAGEYLERLQSVVAELKDLSSSASYEAERVDNDPRRLQQLSERIGVLYSLQQKHRVQSLAELIAQRDEYAQRLQLIADGESQISALEQRLASAEAAANKLAKELRKVRQGATSKFEDGVKTTLAALGMSEVQFIIEVSEAELLAASGGDKVRYLFSSVASRAPQSIERIASGGELSRVMLAIKALLSRSMELPTIIFDEIDTGVSGRIADAMGEIIASLSESMQVIDITHLPQVASKGEAHFVVHKDGGTTQICRLTSEERINQIATMLSGSTITAAALEQARILLRY